MALGDPEEFQAFEPWSWLPKEWETTPPGAATPLPPIVEQTQAIEAAPPVPAPVEQPALPPLPEQPAPMQPGLGLPQSALAGVQPEIEMPAEYVGKFETPDIGGASAFVDQAKAIPDEPLPPLPEPSQFFDPSDPRTWGDSEVSQQDLIRMGTVDPEGFMQHQLAFNQKREAEARDRKAEIDKAKADQEDLLFKQEEEARAEAAAMAKRIAETRIDPGRHMRNMSVPQSIASFLSVVVGGLVHARKGGPNIGLEMLDKAIDRDIHAQEADLSNQRNALAEFRAQGLSQSQARRAYAVASYARALEELQTKMQDYDANGSTAMQGAQATLELRGKMAAHVAAAERQAFKDRNDQLKFNAELAKTNAEAAKLAADAQEKMRKGIGGGGSGKPDDQIIPAAELQRRFPEAAQFVTEDMSVNQLRQRMAVRKQAGDTTQSVGKETPEQERERTLGIGGIRNPDGSSLLASDVDSAKSLQKQKAAVDTINEFVGDIVRGIDEHGGADKYFSSSEWMTQTAKKAAIIQAARAGYEMGALDKGAVEEADKLFGATDPTSHWRNASKGFIAGRDAMVSRFNHALRSLPTHKGASYHPPDMTRGAAKSSKKEAVAKLLDWQTRQDAYGKDPDVIRSLGVPEVLIAETQRGYSRAQQSEADEYAAQAAAGNADAKMKLEGIAARALSPGFKAYAKAKLEALEPKAGTAAPGRSTDLTGVKFE
jgi:hypothetical protein